MQRHLGASVRAPRSPALSLLDRLCVDAFLLVVDMHQSNNCFRPRAYDWVALSCESGMANRQPAYSLAQGGHAPPLVLLSSFTADVASGPTR